MTKRLFLKLLPLAALGAFFKTRKSTPQRKYLTSCSWNEVTGLRFMMGSEEWVVFRKQAKMIDDGIQKKYWARPVHSKDRVFLCCFVPHFEFNTIDFDRVHLEPNTFYRA